MTAISTSFFRMAQDMDVDALIDTLQDLPVTGIELEYRIPAPLVPRIRSVLGRVGLHVSSVHNFFPLPLEMTKSGGSGDLFSLADTRSEERREAVKRTLQTIDHAHDLEARAVVLHCGRVDMVAETRQLYERFQQEGRLTEAHRKWLQGKIVERDRRKPGHLDALCFSLEKLIKAADRRQVSLGLENRYHFHELPGPGDFSFLLREFEGAPLGYWHDTGHAFVSEQLGLTAKGELLEGFCNHLVGVHLHDAEGLNDHLPPGSGRIDFSALAALLPPHALKVMELRPGTPTEAARAGLDHLATCLRQA